MKLRGLTDTFQDYDGFVVDQWGVLHDGIAVYPGVLEALGALATASKTVVIATNSSKSASRNRDRLRDRFAVGEELYVSLVSSAQLLRDALDRDFPELRRAVVIADAGDEALVGDAGLAPEVDVDNADAVILLSVDPVGPTEAVKAQLERAATRYLPLLMPSRDTSTVTTKGVFAGLAGLADHFEAHGGSVTNFGKPEDRFYDAVCAELGGLDPRRVLMIGDQIDSDIRGGHAAGFDTLLVGTGAGAEPFAVLEDGPDSDAARDLSARPTFTLETLRP